MAHGQRGVDGEGGDGRREAPARQFAEHGRDGEPGGGDESDHAQVGQPGADGVEQRQIGLRAFHARSIGIFGGGLHDGRV